MDLVDENEDNPLFYKNLDLRAKVEAINEATVKALPSMDEMVLEEDECDVCLTREQIISKYLKTNENAKIMRDITSDDENDEKPAAHPRSIVADNESNNSLEDHKSGESLRADAEENKENLDLQTFANRRAEGPNKDELLMAKLIKHVAVNCGEYLNPVTGETIFLEEGDTKITQSAHLRTSSRSVKRETSKMHQSLSEKNETCSAYVDIRTKKSSLQLCNKKELSLNNKICSKRCDLKSCIKDDKDVNSDEKNLRKDDSKTSALQSMEEKLVESPEPVYLSISQLKREDGDHLGTNIPRSCIVDGAASKDSFSLQTLTEKDLSSYLTNIIYKIRSPETVSSTLHIRENSEQTSLSDPLSSYTEGKEDNSKSSCSVNDTVDSVWDWVTAIPRACYMDDDYLADCILEPSVSLLDHRLLNETFKLFIPPFERHRNHHPDSKMKSKSELRSCSELSSPSFRLNDLQADALLDATDINQNNKRGSIKDNSVKMEMTESTPVVKTLV